MAFEHIPHNLPPCAKCHGVSVSGRGLICEMCKQGMPQDAAPLPITRIEYAPGYRPPAPPPAPEISFEEAMKGDFNMAAAMAQSRLREQFAADRHAAIEASMDIQNAGIGIAAPAPELRPPPEHADKEGQHWLRFSDTKPEAWLWVVNSPHHPTGIWRNPNGQMCFPQDLANVVGGYRYLGPAEWPKGGDIGEYWAERWHETNLAREAGDRRIRELEATAKVRADAFVALSEMHGEACDRVKELEADARALRVRLDAELMKSYPVYGLDGSIHAALMRGDGAQEIEDASVGLFGSVQPDPLAPVRQHSVKYVPPRRATFAVEPAVGFGSPDHAPAPSVETKPTAPPLPAAALRRGR